MLPGTDTQTGASTAAQVPQVLTELPTWPHPGLLTLHPRLCLTHAQVGPTAHSLGHTHTLTLSPVTLIPQGSPPPCLALWVPATLNDRHAYTQLYTPSHPQPPLCQDTMSLHTQSCAHTPPPNQFLSHQSPACAPSHLPRSPWLPARGYGQGGAGHEQAPSSWAWTQ